MWVRSPLLYGFLDARRAFAAAFDALSAIARCSFFVNTFALAVPPLLPMLAKYLDSSARFMGS
jgi:hypothetical protein